MTVGTASAVAFLAAHACSFAALGGEDVWVSGVLVAPAQMRLQVPGQDDVIRIVRVRHGEHPQRAELRLDRVRPRGVGRRQAQLDAMPPAQARTAGVLFADKLSMIT